MAIVIKYKVKEVAQDLGINTKDVVKIFKDNLDTDVKAMTSLNESQLNFIFDYYTKANMLDNFNSYFAVRDDAIEKAEKEAQQKRDEEKKKRKEAKEKMRNAMRNDHGGSEPQKKKEAPKKVEKTETPAAPVEIEKPAEPEENSSTEQIEIPKEIKSKRGKGRVIDTSSVEINVDRYNQKYVDMAFDNKFKNENAMSSKKQKINQKSKQKGKRSKKRETEQERLNRIEKERKAKKMTIYVPEEITVGDLAEKLKATVAEVIKKAMMMGSMVTINDVVDFDTASLIAMEFHAKVEKEVIVTIEEKIIDDSEDLEENLKERAPIVVVMGHVDHGKTSLLDYIRHAHVTATEAGGITQHIGAYRVNVNDKDITFLDTPGHEAFTTMRARGAQCTDIAILVVAADDGIMPQTVEAINHAKAANVSIIVAVNKMDKPGANPNQIMQQLTEHELVPEEWGGDTPVCLVSAKTGEGIDELLEMVLLVADMKELKANPDRAAKGVVIEARLDKGRGPIATILVQNGTLHEGDTVVAGTSVGHVRVMSDEKGRNVKEAGPSVPVEITGLNDVPVGGDIFNAVSDERLARELVEQRSYEQKEAEFNAQTKVTLDNLFDQMKLGDIQELKIVVKADVQGSVEAVRQSLEKLSNDEVRVHVIHGGVGAINESDVMLASASNAIIVGFNVRPDSVAQANADRDGVDMRLYRVIYDCIEEIEHAMKGMLAPKTREVIIGNTEVRNIIRIKSIGNIAGSYVKSGRVQRDAGVRVIRDGIVIAEDKIASLQRFKDSVKEVQEGYECGIGLEKYNDIREGDIFEIYKIEEYREE